MNNKSVSIALSGSGVKMMCFVGALQALEDSGYEVKRLVGTSGGSIVGTLYAFGKTPQEIKQIIMDWDYKSLILQGLQVPMWRFGLVSSRGIRNIIRKHIGKKDISDASRCKLVITGSNLTYGCVDYFYCDIEVAKAVQISSTVPFGFGYVRHNKKIYVDGGLIDNYPLGVAGPQSIGFLARGIPESPKKVKWPWQYFMALFTAGLSNLEKKHIEDDKWDRTIAIDAGKISGAMNIFITKKQKQSLYDLGYQVTKAKLAKVKEHI